MRSLGKQQRFRLNLECEVAVAGKFGGSKGEITMCRDRLGRVCNRDGIAKE